MEKFNTTDFNDERLNNMPDYVREHVNYLGSKIYTTKNGKAVLLSVDERSHGFIFAGKDLKVYKAVVYMDKAANAIPGIKVCPIEEAEN